MVHTIQTATPRPELREFVRVYAQREIATDDESFSQANTAVLEQVLAFELSERTVLDLPNGESRTCHGVNIWGSLTYPFGGARFSGHILGFAVFLTPFALWQLFGIPPDTIVNVHCDGVSLLGRKMEDLRSMLAACKAFSDRVQVAEEFLLPLALNATARTTIVRTAHHTLRSKGAVRINEIA